MRNVSLLILGFCLIINTGCKKVEKLERRARLPIHHTEDGFKNPYLQIEQGFGDFLKWKLNRGPVESPDIPLEEIGEYVPQMATPDMEKISAPNPNEIQLTWIGHSTFLIQIAGINILTDPIFSDRCSPFSFAGPSRFVKPGLAFEDLPEIHAVIISHDHYDHLDKPTIAKLGNSPKYFIPLKVSAWFEDLGIDNYIELDWWQSQTFMDLEFHCVPAQHFSGRSPFNRNKTLWAGWVLKTAAGNIYFAGDTGYSLDFKQIGERFDTFKLALIPIGAYRPKWFMGPVHVDPEDAVRIHQDVNSEFSIGMHWGTFQLADERKAEPQIYLKKALQSSDVSEDRFKIMKFGETLNIPQAPSP